MNAAAIGRPPAERVVAIVGARMIDGRGGEPVEDAVVVVRGARIAAVGKRSAVTIPAQSEVVPAEGLTVLPGLVDAHFHVSATNPDIPNLFLRAGVTAARDPGQAWERYDAVFQRGKAVPRLFLTDRHFDQEPPAHPSNTTVVRTAEEARVAVERAAERGASAIKVYFRLPVELIRATCAAAHARGLPVVAHLEIVDADRAIEAGLDGIEHVSSLGTVLAESTKAEAFRAAVQANNQARMTGRFRLWADLDVDSTRVSKTIALLRERRVVLSPTLTYFYGTGPGGKQPTDEQRAAFSRMLAFVGKCHAAGVTVVAGSHTMMNVEPGGMSQQREIELLVEAGLTPLEAIRAATLASATYLRAEKRIGSLEPGKLADLLLVDGDPSRDIRALRKVRRVMLNGEWVDGAAAAR